jgi:Uma2 family endonuclease
MAMMVLNRLVEEHLKAERAEKGLDGYDEVWEGIYMMAPLADDEHQDLQTGLGAVFKIAVGWPGIGIVRTGVNVSDREQGWSHNYRVPDIAVFLPGGVGRNCRTHWVGGPDFAIEIVSPGDRSRDKLDFYSTNRVRELLLIDRDPWRLELYRASSAGVLELAGQSAPAGSGRLASSLLPLSFAFLQGAPRPQLEIAHADGVQRWLV